MFEFSAGNQYIYGDISDEETKNHFFLYLTFPEEPSVIIDSCEPYFHIFLKSLLQENYH